MHDLFSIFVVINLMSHACTYSKCLSTKNKNWGYVSVTEVYWGFPAMHALDHPSSNSKQASPAPTFVR